MVRFPLLPFYSWFPYLDFGIHRTLPKLFAISHDEYGSGLHYPTPGYPILTPNTLPLDTLPSTDTLPDTLQIPYPVDTLHPR